MIKSFFRLMRKILKRESILAVRESKEKWDAQYDSGTWDRLLHIEPNIATIAEFIHKESKQSGKPLHILDIGCGNGALYSALSSNSTQMKYHGIDFSGAAISKAAKYFPDAMFSPMDIEHPDGISGTYDILVFSEVLYYVHARRTLLAYKRYAAKESRIIISMYHSWRTAILWILIRPLFLVMEEKDVQRSGGMGRWRVVMAKYRT